MYEKLEDFSEDLKDIRKHFIDNKCKRLVFG